MKIPNWIWLAFIWPKKAHQDMEESAEKFGEVVRQRKAPSLIKEIIGAMVRNKIVVFALGFLAFFYLIGTYSSFVGISDSLPKNGIVLAIFIVLAVVGSLGIFNSLRNGIQGMKGKIFIFVSVLLVFFAGVGLANYFSLPLTPYGYEEIDYTAVRAAPSMTHWFGTDLIGRDVFTRIIFSMGTTSKLSILVIVCGGLFLGVTLGLIAGYFGGRKDNIIMRAGEVVAMMPAFFLFLLLTMSLRPRYEEFFYSFGGIGEWMIQEGMVDFSMIFLVFAAFYWVGSARMVRSQTLQLREMPYIDAAKALGASPFRIITRHILPNISGLIILWTFSTMGAVTMTEIALSYFGLGIRAPHPSFGVMISEVGSIRLAEACPHLLLFPAVMVSLFIFCFAILEMNLNRIISSLYTKGGGK